MDQDAFSSTQLVEQRHFNSFSPFGRQLSATLKNLDIKA
jgi:hypothetical protein